MWLAPEMDILLLQEVRIYHKQSCHNQSEEGMCHYPAAQTDMVVVAGYTVLSQSLGIDLAPL